MADLIAKLEAASEGSWELSARIMCARCGFRFERMHRPETNRMIYHPNLKAGHTWGHDLGRYEQFSTSLDAAAKLVPKGLCWEVEAGPKTGGVACVGTVHGPMEGIAATPALALCIAALKARAAGSPLDAEREASEK